MGNLSWKVANTGANALHAHFTFTPVEPQGDNILFVLEPMHLFSRVDPKALGCAHKKKYHYSLKMSKKSDLAAARIEMRQFLNKCLDRALYVSRNKDKPHVVFMNHLAILDYYTW